MAPKKPSKRTKRPFKPGDPNGMLPDDLLPQCGTGKETQIDIHVASTGTLQLFDPAPPDSGAHFPELVKLTRELNAVFNKTAKPALARRRKETGVKTLEVTIALVKGELYITYAKRDRKRPPR